MKLEKVRNLNQKVLKRVWGSFFLLSEEGIRSRGFVLLLISVNLIQLFSYHAYFSGFYGSNNLNLFEILFSAARVFRLICLQPYLGIFSPVILIFSYNSILLLLIILGIFLPKDLHQTHWCKLLRKLTYTMIVVYEWVIYLPSIEVLFRDNISSIYLPNPQPIAIQKYNSNSNAFFIIYIIIFAILGLAVLLRGFVSVSFKDPGSNYFAQPRRSSLFLVMIAKFLIVMISTLFEGSNPGDWGIDLMFLLVLSLLILSEPFTAIYYDRKVAQNYINCVFVNWMLCWPLLYFHLKRTTELTNQVAVVSAISIAFGLKIYNILREKLLFSLVMRRSFSHPFTLEIHLRFLAYYSASVTTSAQDAVNFYSFIFNHNHKCKKPACECHKIIEYNSKSQSLKVDKLLQCEINNYIIKIYQEFFEYYQKDRKLIFPFYIGYLSLLTFSMKKKAIAYTSALDFLGKIDKDSYDLTIMEFVIQEILSEVGKDLDRNSSKFFHLQVSDALDFYQRKEKLDSQVEKIKMIHSNFFSHLLKEQIDLDYIFLQGRSYLHVRREIKSLFDSAIQLNPTSLEVLEQYIHYHKYVIESPFSDYQIWNTRKNDLILKNIYKDTDLTLENVSRELWNAENGGHYSGHLIVKGLKFEKPGIIEAITPAFLKILGLKSPKEALGKNINEFMPSSLGKHHNDILRRYLSRPEADFSSKNVFNLLFALDNQGFLVPFKLMIKLEAYNQSPTVAGIMKPLKEEFVSLLTSWEGKVQNYTRKFHDIFKLEETERMEGFHICLFIPKLIKYMHLTNEEDDLYSQIASNRKKFYMFVNKKTGEKKFRRELEILSNKLHNIIQGLIPSENRQVSEDQRAEAKKKMRKLILEIPKGTNIEDYNVFKTTLTMKKISLFDGKIRVLLVRFLEWEAIPGLLNKMNIMKKMGFYSKTINRVNGSSPRNINRMVALQASKSDSEVARQQLAAAAAAEHRLILDSKPRSHSSTEQKPSSSAENNKEQDELDNIVLGQMRRKSANSRQSKDERLLHDAIEPHHSNGTGSERSFNLNVSREFSDNQQKLVPVASDIANATKITKKGDYSNELTRREPNLSSPLNDVTNDLPPLTLRQEVSIMDIGVSENVTSRIDFQTTRKDPDAVRMIQSKSSQQMLINPITITAQGFEGLIQTGKQSSISSKKLQKVSSDNLEKTTSQISNTENGFDESLRDANSSSLSRSQIQTTKTDLGSAKLRRGNDARNSNSSHQLSDTAKKFYRDIINSNKLSIFLRSFNSLGILYGVIVVSIYISIPVVTRQSLTKFEQLNTYLNSSPILGAGVTGMTVQLAKTELILNGVAAYNATELIQAGAVAAGTDDATLADWDAFWENWLTAIFNQWIVGGVNNYTSLDGVNWISGTLLEATKIPYVLTGIDGPNQNTVVGLSVYLDLIKYYSSQVNYFNLLSVIGNSEASLFFLDNRQTNLNLVAELDANNLQVVYDSQVSANSRIQALGFLTLGIIFVVVVTFYLAVRRAAQLREKILVLFSKISVSQILPEAKKFTVMSSLTEQSNVAGTSLPQSWTAKERIFSKYKIQRHSYNFRSIVIFTCIYLILCIPPLVITLITRQSLSEIVTVFTNIADVATLIRQINNFQVSAYLIFGAYYLEKANRTQLYESDFLPAYNQLLNGTQNLQNFLYNLKSNKNLFDDNTTQFITQSLDQDFCSLLPIVDPLSYGIEISDYDFSILTIIHICTGSLGLISTQGIIISQYALISAIAQDVQTALNLEAGDLAGIQAITSSVNYYYYDKFGLYISYYHTLLTNSLIQSGAWLINISSMNSAISSTVSILLTTIFFAVGWLFFLRRANARLRRAKEILNILPYSILSRNVYIQSFLLSESRKSGIN